MDPLELLCPSCEQVLVLDAGFAGGVCRCSNCGMLMSVPASTSTQRPSSARRPNRPGEPTATPHPPTQTRVSKPKKSLPVEDEVEIEIEVEDLTQQIPSITKPVRKPRTPPPPRRRSRAKTPFLQNRKLVIWASVVGIVLLIIVGLALALSGFVHYQANRPPPGQETPQQIVTFDYDANANPYLLDKPNLLGIPISPRTVMVVEASQSSRTWLGLVKNAILTGTNFDSSVVAIQLVFATADGVVIFPDKPETWINSIEIHYEAG